MTSRCCRPGPATKVPLCRHTSKSTLGGAMPPPRGRRTGVRALCVLAVVSLVVLAHPAAALEVASVRRGTCSGASLWTQRVVRDGGLLRVRLAVRGGRAGQRWNIFMDHNGTGFFAGYRISRVDGSWVVRRRVRNLAGMDTIRFGAHNVVTGETCRGRTAA
jgi:hypothetical protein